MAVLTKSVEIMTASAMRMEIRLMGFMADEPTVVVQV
jgi:hypothetical protein